MTKKSAISDDTRRMVLDAAWKKAVESDSLSLPFSKLAEAVGVSRQTLYLAFGSRGQMLQAMLDNHDAQSEAVQRMVRARTEASGTWEELEAYLEAWLDVLPQVFPVAWMLQRTAADDPQAAEGYKSRFHDRLRMGIRGMLQKLEANGAITSGLPASEAGDLVWNFVHTAQWQLLVVESGWTPEAFRQSRIVLAHVVVRGSLP